MEKKKISISRKRQITIPNKFFAELGFEKEAVCFICEDSLVITPLKSKATVAAEILKELLKQGLKVKN